mmetsp:Transcript_30179/g.97309  ORF Transcript_30179/g.97309 Transcript_30179/m.97309 type:complete len:278 (-) Transcript_30179:15-848(-)
MEGRPGVVGDVDVEVVEWDRAEGEELVAFEVLGVEVGQARSIPGCVVVRPPGVIRAEGLLVDVLRNDEEATSFCRLLGPPRKAVPEGGEERAPGRPEAMLSVGPGSVGGVGEDEDVELARVARRVEQLVAEAAAGTSDAVDVAAEAEDFFRGGVEAVEEAKGVGGIDVDVDVVLPGEEPPRSHGPEQRPGAEAPSESIGDVGELAEQLVIAPRRTRQKRFQLHIKPPEDVLREAPPPPPHDEDHHHQDTREYDHPPYGGQRPERRRRRRRRPPEPRS